MGGGYPRAVLDRLCAYDRKCKRFFAVVEIYPVTGGIFCFRVKLGKSVLLCKLYRFFYSKALGLGGAKELLVAVGEALNSFVICP